MQFSAFRFGFAVFQGKMYLETMDLKLPIRIRDQGKHGNLGRKLTQGLVTPTQQHVHHCVPCVLCHRVLTACSRTAALELDVQLQSVHRRISWLLYEAPGRNLLLQSLRTHITFDESTQLDTAL